MTETTQRETSEDSPNEEFLKRNTELSTGGPTQDTQQGRGPGSHHGSPSGTVFSMQGKKKINQ